MGDSETVRSLKELCAVAQMNNDYKERWRNIFKRHGLDPEVWLPKADVWLIAMKAEYATQAVPRFRTHREVKEYGITYRGLRRPDRSVGRSTGCSARSKR